MNDLYQGLLIGNVVGWLIWRCYYLGSIGNACKRHSDHDYRVTHWLPEYTMVNIDSGYLIGFNCWCKCSRCEAERFEYRLKEES